MILYFSIIDPFMAIGFAADHATSQPAYKLRQHKSPLTIPPVIVVLRSLQ